VKICPPSTATVLAASVTVAAAGFVGIGSASTAAADQATEASTSVFGSQATVVNGDIVQGWTVSDLKPSSDAIPYPVQGALWEATATDEAIKGPVIPIVANLNARTSSGQSYRVLYQIATPQGINPATLSQGQKTTGKVYFDVTGDAPNRIVYSSGSQELASWAPSPPPLRPSTNAATSATATVAMPTTAAAAPTPPPAGHQAPGANPATPAAAAGQGAPVPGSQGTPIAADTPVTPELAGSQGTTTLGSQGTPMPLNGPVTPAPSPTPASPGPSPGQDTPAATAVTPAPVGSQPSPVGSPTPTTTAVPAAAPVPPG